MKQNLSLKLMLLTILPIAFCSTMANAQSGSKAKTGSSTMSADKTSSRLVTMTSQQGFDETYDALKTAVESKDLKVIAEINHTENAEMAEMKLPPTKVIIFGNPKMGSPLMKANPSMALDLPQRMAVYEDAQGKVHVTYNDPQVIAKEHGLTGQDKIIGKMSKALKMLATKATGGVK